MFGKKSKQSILNLCALIGLSFAFPAAANVVVSVTGNVARADFALGGTPSNPQYTGTLFLTFEGAVNLTASNLNITAQIVNPNNPAFTSRISGGANVSVPAAFPVMISVHPSAASGFEFLNATDVELYTTNVSYTANSPYRLYKAPANGTFFDITEDVLEGSVRCRARTPGFSDFIMVSDTRSDLEAAQDKFLFLAARVEDDDIDATTAGLLQLDLDEALEEFLEGDYEDARAELDDLELRVSTQAGSTIPNRWIAGGSLDNVAGSLEAEAASLDFYLRKLAAAAAAGGSGGDEGDDD
jgi:hypothetical protein